MGGLVGIRYYYAKAAASGAARGVTVESRPLTVQEELLLYDRRVTVQNVDAAGDHLDGKALGLAVLA